MSASGGREAQAVGGRVLNQALNEELRAYQHRFLRDNEEKGYGCVWRWPAAATVALSLIEEDHFRRNGQAAPVHSDRSEVHRENGRSPVGIRNAHQNREHGVWWHIFEPH